MTRLFLVDGKTSTPASGTSLPEADLRERDHLQEWVIANPEVLGEDVLVVTSEYGSWAAEVGDDLAYDRLDVLGLDSVGRLVVVELKRGVATRDIHLQAITYAALVSRFTLETLTHAHAAFLSSRGDAVTDDDARDRLLAHVGGELDSGRLKQPRQVLVASAFPKQVTSSVVWLSEMGLDVSLIQVALWKVGAQLVADFTTIYPTPVVEEFTLGPRREEAAEAGKRIERTRNRNVVHVLIDTSILVSGHRLRIAPSHGAPAGIRQQINDWLDEDDDRRWATWTGDRSKAIRWREDGGNYSPTGLADHLFERVTGDAASGIQGTLWFVLDDDEGCPEDVDPETWAELQNKTLVDIAKIVGDSAGSSERRASVIDRLLAPGVLTAGQELTVVVPRVGLDLPSIRAWLTEDPRREKVQWRQDRAKPLTWSYDQQAWAMKDLVREIVQRSTGVSTNDVWWPRWFAVADGRALNKVADDAD